MPANNTPDAPVNRNILVAVATGIQCLRYGIEQGKHIPIDSICPLSAQ